MLADIKGEFEDWYPTGREVACLKEYVLSLLPCSYLANELA